MSNPTLAQVIAALTPLFADAPVASVPVVARAAPAAAPAPVAVGDLFLPAAFTGRPLNHVTLRWVPWTPDTRIAVPVSDDSVGAVHFTTGPSHAGYGRLQTMYQGSQQTDRYTSIVRDRDSGVIWTQVVAPQAMIEWDFGGSEDWLAHFEPNTAYTLLIANAQPGGSTMYVDLYL